MKKYVSLGIMITLYSGKRYTAPELAERYETSVKTIYRAIDTLLEAGMPIRCIAGKGGGYEIIKESKIDTSFFTLSELGSFISFIKSTKGSLPHENTTSLEDRIHDLPDSKMKDNLLLITKSMVFDTENWGSVKQNALLSEQIKESILECKKLEIEYQSRASVIEKRIIHPYTIVFKSGIWYMYAFCEIRNAFRLFKLSRIKTLIKQPETFERQNIDTLSKPWNKEFENSLEKINVRMLINKNIMPEIVEWLGVNSLKFCTQKCNQNQNQNKDKIEVESQVSFSKGLVHRLMQFGRDITVLSPQKLKEEIANECLTIYKSYMA